MKEFLQRITALSPERLRVLALDLHERGERARQESRAPIAVVGIGCRLPGGVQGPDDFWALLEQGVNAATDIPSDRWDIEDYYDPDPEAPDSMYTRRGNFVDDVDRFDADFFGISPREAESMDPQQRLLLEVAWEAIEHAGVSPALLKGSSTGVFIGISNSDYLTLQTSGGHTSSNAYVATGGSPSVASGRLSYTLGLQGPAMSVDTACSSSLVAVHLACRALRARECEAALAGGVNLILWPEVSVSLCKARMLARDGLCKTFDARADGFARGEGAGIVMLKRLSDAVAADDRVLAVIKGSATNQDGRSNGLTAPNGLAQQFVIRAALEDAGVPPARVGYVEAHGTGTELGDPIEVQALGAVLREGRSDSNPVTLGSVKTNLGHLEAAAGVTGLIKAVLCLHKRQIPPHLHFESPNPHIDWASYPLRIGTELAAWPDSAEPRIAGVSSFGFSGSNAHVVLEEAPTPLVAPPVGFERTLHVLPLSARTPEALRDLAARYDEFLRTSTAGWADVCATAGRGRAHHEHRLPIVAASAEGAQQALQTFVAHGSDVVPDARHVKVANDSGIAFLFSGQGAQYPGMGRGLYETHPTFRQVIDQCDEFSRTVLDQPLTSVLFADDRSGSIHRTAYTQPALFALEMALAGLWQEWGIEPTVVLGHSVGEFAAACTAGVFSLEDGFRLIAERGRLMQQLPPDGSMAAVFLDRESVADLLGTIDGRVSIASVNGPEQTVVSGASDSVERLVREVESRGIETRRLEVSHAFHSPLIDPVLDDLRRAAARATCTRPRLDLVSTVTGSRAGDEMCRPEYWASQARQPVEFSRAIMTAHENGCSHFIEIGPHSTLLGLGRASLPDPDAAWLPSLRRGTDDWDTIAESVARAYELGHPIDWRGFDTPYVRARVSLPTYPFRKDRFWFQEERGVDRRSASVRRPTRTGGPVHPLLGAGLRTASHLRIFDTHLSLEAMPFLRDHRIGGVALLPAPVYVEMTLAASATERGESRQLEDFIVERPVTLVEGEVAHMQVIVDERRGCVEIFKATEQDQLDPTWTRVAVGHVIPSTPNDAPLGSAAIGDEVRTRCTDTMTGEAFYAELRKRGVDFGPVFQGVTRVWRRDGESLATIESPGGVGGGSHVYCLDPALLDACFHTVGAALPGGGTQGPDRDTYLMTGFDQLRWGTAIGTASTSELVCHARIRSTEDGGDEVLVGDLQLSDADGDVHLEIGGLTMKRARPDTLVRGRVEEWLYEVAWIEQRSPVARPGVDSRIEPPGDLSEAMSANFAALREDEDLQRYTQLVGALDELATCYVEEAFGELGWLSGTGGHLEVSELLEEVDVPDWHHRLVGRLFDMLEEDGLLPARRDEGDSRPPGPRTTSAEKERLVRDAYPHFADEIALLVECGTRLAGVLSGTTDPVQILFPGGSMARVEGVTERSPIARAYNGLAANVVESIVAASPGDARIRVLEVGAGTGGTSASVLPTLPEDRTDYLFTDLSQLFLSRAGRKFEEYPFMTFGTFDLESSPGPQGLERESFDLIVASHVVHATRDIGDSLRRLKDLLSPGGTLLLLEGRGAMRWVDLTFGLTEGWWRFSDEELRASHPLVATDEWARALSDAGFADVVALPDGSIEHAWPAVLVARRPRVAPRAEPDILLPDTTPGRWLVVGGLDALVSDLVTALEASGQSCSTLGCDGFSGEAGVATLRTAVVEALELESRSDPPWRGVVHLAGLGERVAGRRSADEVGAVAELGCGTALAVVQAIAAAQVTARPPLWLVSRGAQPSAATGAIDPAQAALWGFGRTVASEHPEFWGGLIDLDPERSDRDAGHLVAELGSGSEDQVSYREGVRHVPRLRRTHRPSSASPVFHAEASYLITGGWGGIGLEVARWAIDHGAGMVVLMGRSAPSEAASEVIDELRGRGATVRIHRGDVTRERDVASVLAEIEASGTPLRGVFHAAGVFDDRVLIRHDWDRFERVLAPKVRGGWLLHDLTRENALDFFVLFSSAASFLAPVGLGNYAAANAFADSLAEHRRRRGLSAISLDWGPWEGTGMADAVGPGRAAQWSQGGFGSIPVDDALEVLGRSIQSGDAAADSSHLAVLPGDWMESYRGMRSPPPLFRELLAEDQGHLGSTPVPAGPGSGRSFKDDLAALDEGDRFEALTRWVAEQVRSVLGFRNSQTLDATRGFFDLGMDSLTAVELKNRLQDGLDVAVASTLVFDYATVDDLAEQLGSQLHLLRAEDMSDASDGAQVGVGDDTQAMSEDELASALARKLEELG